MKSWFQQLSPEMKCLWLFLCENCDAAGVWETNFPLASFIIGTTITRESLAAFGDRLVELPSGRIWIESFIAFQYGKLSRECRPHQRVLEALEKHGIGYQDGACFVPGVRDSEPKSISTLSDTLSHRVSNTLEEEDKDKEGEGVQRENEKGNREASSFAEFWAEYPKKVSKGFAEKAWKQGSCGKLLPRILEALRVAKVGAAGTKEGGQFIPHPATWIRARGWEDEHPPVTANSAFATVGGSQNDEAEEWPEFLKSINRPGQYPFQTAPGILRTDFRNWKKAPTTLAA